MNAIRIKTSDGSYLHDIVRLDTKPSPLLAPSTVHSPALKSKVEALEIHLPRIEVVKKRLNHEKIGQLLAQTAEPMTSLHKILLLVKKKFVRATEGLTPSKPLSPENNKKRQVLLSRMGFAILKNLRRAANTLDNAFQVILSPALHFKQVLPFLYEPLESASHIASPVLGVASHGLGIILYPIKLVMAYNTKKTLDGIINELEEKTFLTKSDKKFFEAINEDLTAEGFTYEDFKQKFQSRFNTLLSENDEQFNLDSFLEKHVTFWKSLPIGSEVKQKMLLRLFSNPKFKKLIVRERNHYSSIPYRLDLIKRIENSGDNDQIVLELKNLGIDASHDTLKAYAEKLRNNPDTIREFNNRYFTSAQTQLGLAAMLKRRRESEDKRKKNLENHLEGVFKNIETEDSSETAFKNAKEDLLKLGIKTSQIPLPNSDEVTTIESMEDLKKALRNPETREALKKEAAKYSEALSVTCRNGLKSMTINKVNLERKLHETEWTKAKFVYPLLIAISAVALTVGLSVLIFPIAVPVWMALFAWGIVALSMSLTITKFIDLLKSKPRYFFETVIKLGKLRLGIKKVRIAWNKARLAKGKDVDKETLAKLEEEFHSLKNRISEAGLKDMLEGGFLFKKLMRKSASQREFPLVSELFPEIDPSIQPQNGVSFDKAIAELRKQNGIDEDLQSFLTETIGIALSDSVEGTENLEASIHEGMKNFFGGDDVTIKRIAKKLVA